MSLIDKIVKNRVEKIYDVKGMSGKELIKNIVKPRRKYKETGKKKQNKKRSYATNTMVKEYLLDKGFDQIWFKRHTRRKDKIYTQKGTTLRTDLFGLFDGMCMSNSGTIYYLQMKTNSWGKRDELKEFAHSHKVNVLLFNVSNKLKESKGKWKLYWESYQ